MKSTTGDHFIALDHVRALAAFMVFVWHFIHGMNGTPVAFEYVPAFPTFSLLDEGHTGVSLFMTLSGYLFARLLDGKEIHFGAFLWNRALRLLPLLLLVILVRGCLTNSGWTEWKSYFQLIASGLVEPVLPNGGWSITVEFHFYVMLPALLGILRLSKLRLLWVVAGMIGLRTVVWYTQGQVQSLAHWTIIGRMDQFVLGMVICQFRHFFDRRHGLAIGVMVFFSLFYGWFNHLGGLYRYLGYPSSGAWWIVLPTIEGLSYAMLIAWYERSFQFTTSGLSGWIGKIGEYSYSIYLLHFFIVFEAARFIHERLYSLSNFYVATLSAGVVFLLMGPVGALSFRWIESPFLRLRKRYVIARTQSAEDSVGPGSLRS
ncbi:MAG: acyltransferase [Planctomycetota bacterium]|nr:MAG: acyltransferase [Planctomycetota bacterium]